MPEHSGRVFRPEVELPDDFELLSIEYGCVAIIFEGLIRGRRRHSSEKVGDILHTFHSFELQGLHIDFVQLLSIGLRTRLD